jgi:hypothetical protein
LTIDFNSFKASGLEIIKIFLPLFENDYSENSSPTSRPLSKIPEIARTPFHDPANDRIHRFNEWLRLIIWPTTEQNANEIKDNGFYRLVYHIKQGLSVVVLRFTACHPLPRVATPGKSRPRFPD